MTKPAYDKTITAPLVVDRYNRLVFEGSKIWPRIRAVAIQRTAWLRKSFKRGTWGGEFRTEFGPRPGEIVASAYWCSSGFANTDLDLQLKKYGIH